MLHLFHHRPKLTCVKPQMSSFGCGPYRRVAQQVRHTSSQDVCTQVCCCAWPHPRAPFSPPFPHPGGERVLGGLAGVIPLTAEALSGKPCADLGSPAGNMPEIHVHHLMCYTDACAVDTQQDILGSCYLTTGTYAKILQQTTWPSAPRLTFLYSCSESSLMRFCSLAGLSSSSLKLSTSKATS